MRTVVIIMIEKALAAYVHHCLHLGLRLGWQAFGVVALAVFALRVRCTDAAVPSFVHAILFLLRRSPRTEYAGGPATVLYVPPRCGMSAYLPPPLMALASGTRYAIRRLPRVFPDETHPVQRPPVGRTAGGDR